MNKINYIDLEGFLAEYSVLETYVRSRYDVRLSDSQRVLREALELNIKGLLDERIFNIFRELADDWEYGLLEILFENRLTDKDVQEILRSQVYDLCRSSFNKMLLPYTCDSDPNFSIWRVEVDIINGYCQLECLGDYRIEQWHQEHGIAKVSISETTTLDIDHFFAFVKRKCGYTLAPSTIRREPKVDFYRTLTNTFTEFMLSERSTLENKLFRLLAVLQHQTLITDVTTVFEEIRTYFDLEVKNRLDKLSSNRAVNNFVITGSEIVINFGVSRTFHSKSYAELELQIAEVNGDYIPERQRATRG